MKKLFFICLLSFAILTMAEKTNLDELLANSNTKFTTKMFYEVVKATPRKSVVLSAYSVLTPLAQLALASVDESHDELLEAIGMPNDNVTKAAFSYVNSKLRSVKGITLKTASKIYVANNYELNKDFTVTSRETFSSEIQNIDFLQPQKAADEVNAWVEDQTNHRIKNLVEPNLLTVDTRALLVNAIYFKGIWKSPFDENDTTNKNFFVTENKVIQVPTMYKRGNFKYIENEELKAQIIEIPYEGDESSFVIVLPREIDGINELEEKLKDPTILDRAINDMDEVKVDVYLPKLKIETTTNLKEILQKINVKNIFIPELAKLKNLLHGTDDLYIKAAVQKAFIEINEEGAEAAAANVFYVYEITSINHYEKRPIQFVANRPFYFAVKTNSLTIFNGVMRDI